MRHKRKSTDAAVKRYVRWAMRQERQRSMACQCASCGAVTIDPDVQPLNTFAGYYDERTIEPDELRSGGVL